PISYAPGAVIVRQGDPADHFYIILKGEVEVLLEQDGGETPIARLISGEFFAEAGLLQGGRRTATVRAGSASDTILMELERTSFNPLLAGSEPTREEIARVMRLRLLGLESFRTVGDAYA